MSLAPERSRAVGRPTLLKEMVTGFTERRWRCVASAAETWQLRPSSFNWRPQPFKDITDRDLFAGLIMAAFAFREPAKPMDVHASRAVEAADHSEFAALKVPVGKPPGNAMRGQDDIDDRNA